MPNKNEFGWPTIYAQWIFPATERMSLGFHIWKTKQDERISSLIDIEKSLDIVYRCLTWI